MALPEGTAGGITLRSMHIGLNLVFLVPGEQGGMETYARELIPELVAMAPQHRFTAFVGRAAAAADGPWRELTGSVLVPVNARDRLQWVRGEQLLLPPAARRAGIDLLHSFASTAPGWGPYRRVVTVHDLIYRTIPEAHPGVRSLGMRVLVPLGARRSDRVIVDARATAEEVRRFLHVPSTRIDVVPLGLGLRRASVPTPEAELRAGLEAGSRPIVLSVSAKLAHKNLTRLIGALARIPQPTRPLLVLPGYPTPHEQELRARAEELNVSGDVRFLGWVSAADLEALYAAAAAFVLPTLAEGFGLPVLEAMACGAPVLTTYRTSLPEVGGDAVAYTEPEADAIASALRALLDDPDRRVALGEAGHARARQFTWAASAAAHAASYKRAAESRLQA